jgi:uncharacterized protein YcbX
MERRQIGVVQELFRYPVKSMLGERLREVDIGAHGVIGDRAYVIWAISNSIGCHGSKKPAACRPGSKGRFSRTSF